MKDLKNLEKDMVRWRRELHAIPEVGLHLPRTSKYLRRELDKLNIEYREYISGNGLAAYLGQGKTVALRVDMDGLPIMEETGLEFSSRGMAMHACGHDAHMALGLGILAYYKDLEASMDFRLVVIFQPGEEHPGGALPMIKEGIIEDFEISSILGLHMGNIMDEKPGQVCVKAGPIMAASDIFSIIIRGSGAHGGQPNLGTDNILIASLIVSQLQYLISRELDPREPGVISFGKFHGGSSFNIIPSEVELEGTFRSLREDSRHFVAGRIGELAQDIASSYGAEAQVDYNFRYPTVENDPDMTEIFLETSRARLGKNRISVLETGTMAGDDMSYFLQRIPGVYFFFSTPGSVEGVTYPHHHPKFNIDEGYFLEILDLLQANLEAFSKR